MSFGTFVEFGVTSVKVARAPLCGLLLAAVLAGCASQFPQPPVLEVALQSKEQIWNAVARFNGQTYVAGPRWTGGSGSQLSVFDAQGQRSAFPDPSWNAWGPGQDPRKAFVNINALRLEKSVLWVVDTGAAEFGGNPLTGGAKLVAIDLVEKRVLQSYPFSAEVARPGSYIDDVRFAGQHAFLTDAGNAGIIVLDLVSGDSRRVLDGHRSVTAGHERNIVLGGQVLKAPDGTALRVNADPLEVSPNGEWLYFGPLQGPWSKVRIADLTASALTPAQLASRVEPFADLPPTGGTVMDASGNLYFSDLAQDAIRVRRPDGRIETLIVDPRLHWVDAPFLDRDGTLWLPAAQMDRVGLFNDGTTRVQWPMTVFRLSKR
jgi:hypothetical protein